MRHEVQLKILDQLAELKRNGRDQAMLGHVVTLPTKHYTDPSIFDEELCTVFQHYPTLAGHSSSVTEPGSYLLSDWDRFPYVIVRGKDGCLRAFLNICRHRGARLVSSNEGHLKAFVCPFHGWSYNLEGAVIGIPKPYDFPNIDRSKFSLIELSVIERAGLIWIHPTPGANINLDKYLGPIGDDLDNFNLTKLVRYKKTHVVKRANWKLLIQTYLEGYHVPHLHRDTLSSAFRGGVIAHYEYGKHLRLAAARTNFEDMEKYDRESRHILNFASVYYSLFPQAFFIIHPDYVSINMFYPKSPDRTIWTHEMLYDPSRFMGAKGQESLERRFQYTNNAVFDAEDFAVAEGIQIGLSQKSSATHTLGLEEGLLAMFQANVSNAIDEFKK